MRSRLLQTSVLRVIERTLLLSELSNGVGNDERLREDKFVSDLFKGVVMYFNESSGPDITPCSELGVGTIGQFIAGVDSCIKTNAERTKLSEYVYGNFFHAFRSLKDKSSVGSDIFDMGIANKLGKFISAEYDRLGQLVKTELGKAGNHRNIRKNTALFMDIIHNNGPVQKLFRDTVLAPITYTYNTQKNADTDNKIVLLMNYFMFQYDKYKSDSDAIRQITKTLQSEKINFLDLMMKLKRRNRCSYKKTIDLFFQQCPQDTQNEKPLIESIMKVWIHGYIFLNFKPVGDNVRETVIHEIEQLCSDIHEFVEKKGREGEDTPVKVRLTYHLQYNEIKNRTTEADVPVNIFEGLFEIYFSHGGWEEFYEKLLIGPMAIGY
jgi:hypothetical protein